MAIDFSKLLSHPLKDEIISKLVTGISPKDVSDWLKVKYSSKDTSHLRLAAKNLKDFVDNNLDLYKTLQTDLANPDPDQDREISASLKNNKTYQERIAEIADTELDIERFWFESIHMMRARMEQVFDKVQQNPENTKPDYALIKWFETLGMSLEKYDKFKNDRVETVVNQNITVQMVDKYVFVLQDAIRDVMSEIDPDIAFLFSEKLTKRLSELDLPITDLPSQETRMKEVKILKEKIDSDTEDDK